MTYRVVEVHEAGEKEYKSPLGKGETIEKALTDALLKRFENGVDVGQDMQSRTDVSAQACTMRDQVTEELLQADIRIEKGTETVTEWEEVPF